MSNIFEISETVHEHDCEYATEEEIEAIVNNDRVRQFMSGPEEHDVFCIHHLYKSLDARFPNLEQKVYYCAKMDIPYDLYNCNGNNMECVRFFGYDKYEEHGDCFRCKYHRGEWRDVIIEGLRHKSNRFLRHTMRSLHYCITNHDWNARSFEEEEENSADLLCRWNDILRDIVDLCIEYGNVDLFKAIMSRNPIFFSHLVDETDTIDINHIAKILLDKPYSMSAPFVNAFSESFDASNYHVIGDSKPWNALATMHNNKPADD